MINNDFNLANLSFQQGDIYTLKQNFLGDCDGIISLQTLSWLPDFQEPLAAMMEINPDFIALSSLFFEGDISRTTQVLEHKRSRSTFYNTYSIPQVESFVRSYSYHIERLEPFEIDVDLPKSKDVDFMSTYTINVNEQTSRKVKRLQFSGPLLLNWYFLMIKRGSFNRQS